MRLRKKRQLFTEEYLIDLDATKAAVRAGYSPKTAHSQGHRLLKDPVINAAIQQAMKERARRVELKADDVIEELRRIAFTNMSDVVSINESGATFLKNSESWPEDSKSAVAEVAFIENNSGVHFRIKMHDKIKALELLGKHLGILRENIEIAGKNGGPIEVSNARQELLRKLVPELAGSGKTEKD